jgi:hypothetical protein
MASASDAALKSFATFLNPSSAALSENAWYYRFACDSPANAAITFSCVAMVES